MKLALTFFFFYWIRDERGGGGNYKFIVQLCAR